MCRENSGSSDRERVRRIFTLLEEGYPRAKTGLLYGSPFQLFVAVVLSARTTDEQVNRITGKLFAFAPTPHHLAGLEPAQLEPYLKSCGLWRQKSRYLVEASRIIVRKHGGQLPAAFADLAALPGAGRKTANVVLHAAFGIPALAVDTHVYRVSRRLGLAAGPGVERVEDELKELLPPEEWGAAHHRLIAHGRRVCTARQPQCGDCFLREHCPSRGRYLKKENEEG
jgi:endonuclease III